MSVAVCRGPAVPAFDFEAPAWLRPAKPYRPEAVVADDRPAQVDIWNAIQADVDSKVAAAKKPYPYVTPRVRRSMSKKSLEVCTESLGCETGSGDFTDAVDMSCLFGGSPLPPAPVEAEESFWEESSAAQESQPGDDLVMAVNYHSSGGSGRRSPRRSFPPPLASMSSRDGPCLKMCSRRQDGRLVVEAVVVRPRGYLQANRQGGRLCLSFIECSARGQSGTPSKSAAPAEASYFPVVEDKCEPEQEVAMQVEKEEEEEDEEEVEVVDRGTMVEVKVSSQPQAPAAAKVHRSTLVINKFVGSTPFTLEQARCHADAPHSEPSARDEAPTLRRVPSSTTTLAAAVAVASTETGAPHTPIDGDDSDDEDECGGQHQPALAAADTKQQLLLFTSRRGDKHDLLQSVRRCRQLRQKPLFILEQYCIATS